MTIKIAINGYGRIGRNILRAYYENFTNSDIELVAINDLGSPETLLHLTKYDTTHGCFSKDISLQGNAMIIGGKSIVLLSERNPEALPWKKLGVDIVLECSGLFTNSDEAKMHITAGASKVLISAPGSGDIDATIVFGVNHNNLKPEHKIISNASCTTNCLANIADPIHTEFGIEYGLMTTIHAFTNDQVLCDVIHKDIRRARSATQSMIPTKTGAASAVGLVIPELNGKLDGFAIRVPTLNVSMVDLSMIITKPATVDAIHQCIKNRVNNVSLAYTEEPLVSIDFNHNPASAIFDGTLTKVSGSLVKICAWYDNEWGFSNRMLDVTKILAS